VSQAAWRIAFTIPLIPGSLRGISHHLECNLASVRQNRSFGLHIEQHLEYNEFCGARDVNLHIDSQRLEVTSKRACPEPVERQNASWGVEII